MIDIDEVLMDMVSRSGSDLHLKVGRRPLFRIAGDIGETDYPVMSEEDITAVVRRVSLPRDFKRFEEDFELDIAYEIPRVARFRINAFRQRRCTGVVMRAIPLQIPKVEELGLPSMLRNLVEKPSGLILVTGPTGSGKSTTLASLIDHINQTRPVNIVTLEDPVEFVYTDSLASINQRQVYRDIPSFDAALKCVIRQDPDVILMGEMRDRESIEFGIHAAETGHLVFSTLHTNDAKQTIDRILDTFSGAAQLQIRKMLAMTLVAILSQRLLKRSDRTGRVAVLEILVNNPQIRQLVEEGKQGLLEKAMKQGAEFYGMQTFNQALAAKVNEGVITIEAAMQQSANPGDLQLILRGIGSGSVTMDSGDRQIPEPAPEEEKREGASAIAERYKRKKEAEAAAAPPRESSDSGAPPTPARRRSPPHSDSLSELLKRRKQ
jgi:twitching motility protein PilT